MKLNVFLGSKKAGTLESTENRGVIFTYDDLYLKSKFLTTSFVFVVNFN